MFEMGIDFRLLQIHFDANLMTKTHTRIEIKEMKIDYRKMNEQIGVVSVGCVCVFVCCMMHTKNSLDRLAKS